MIFEKWDKLINYNQKGLNIYLSTKWNPVLKVEHGDKINWNIKYNNNKKEGEEDENKSVIFNWCLRYVFWKSREKMKKKKKKENRRKTCRIKAPKKKALNMGLHTIIF